MIRAALAVEHRDPPSRGFVVVLVFAWDERFAVLQAACDPRFRAHVGAVNSDGAKIDVELGLTLPVDARSGAVATGELVTSFYLAVEAIRVTDPTLAP